MRDAAIGRRHKLGIGIGIIVSDCEELTTEQLSTRLDRILRDMEADER